jgi:hypothetical protein|tara:strand:+ start:70 stop:486 length:417 start_codon:yes stop_codon:yes gene_type:complete
MEEEIKLYSVISALVEVDNELIFQNGYGYKTELRSYTHYVMNKNNDVYTIEDLNGEEFEGTIEELCELSTNYELTPDGWNDEKESFVINGKIDDKFDINSDEDDEPSISYKYGEFFYKSYDEADVAFNKSQSSFVKLF